MNYVISIVTPEALPRLEELTEELGLPLNVTLHGHPEYAGLPGH